MSNKPGRNAPCPCGSGKKYKRCCLTTDETVARERARQQAPFDDELFGDLDAQTDDDEALFDVEDDPFVDSEDEAPLLDVRAIVRVCYTRGLVNRLSDLRSGRGVQVTEWEAPQIPQAVLDSIEREAADALEGEWGDPKIGDPIQVDVIDLETESDVVSIHVFNRGICLIHTDSEEMRRIHRVCGALEAAASGGQQSEPSDPQTVATVEDGDASQAAPAFDPPPLRLGETGLAALLKEHRRQGGTCALCGKTLTRGSTRKHFAACVPAHDVASGEERPLLQIRVTSPGLPAYWLDLEAKGDARLDAIDSFLRRIWLECCGHLSVFNIGSAQYFSRGYDFGFDRGLGLGRQIPKRKMSARVADVLPPVGEPFDYEYDFGSTTALQLKVTSERTGRPGRDAVRLLARNTAPAWPCATCGQPASLVCAYCLDAGDAYACAVHADQHGCGETEGFLPVVNSPRMGVCAYGSET